MLPQSVAIASAIYFSNPTHENLRLLLLENYFNYYDRVKKIVSVVGGTGVGGGVSND